MLTADEVADAMIAAWTSAEPGAAYVIQPGIGAVPYKFKGVPSAKTETRRDRRRPGGAAPAVDALRALLASRHRDPDRDRHRAPTGGGRTRRPPAATP